GDGERQPSWSPDGTQILYSADVAGPVGSSRCSDLYIRNADGTGTPARLTNTDTFNESHPSMSVNGEIVFSRVPCDPNTGTDTGQADIWKLTPNGNGGYTATQLTTNAGDERHPAWSNEGTA